VKNRNEHKNFLDQPNFFILVLKNAEKFVEFYALTSLNGCLKICRLILEKVEKMIIFEKNS